jgi:hypothetical protein
MTPDRRRFLPEGRWVRGNSFSCVVSSAPAVSVANVASFVRKASSIESASAATKPFLTPRTRCEPGDSDPAFYRQKARFAAAFPALQLIESRRLALFAYPLSGGLRPWNLLPAGLVLPLLHIERWLEPLLGWFMASRMIVVIERRGHN